MNELADHAEAAKVAEWLRSQGLPVMGVQLFDAGFRIGIAFRLPDGKVRAFSFPKDQALATPELFAVAYVEACREIGREPVRVADADRT